ncbi:MAG: EF-hand domain-containing protein [Candidatus Sericytochromatia bacterium]
MTCFSARRLPLALCFALLLPLAVQAQGDDLKAWDGNRDGKVSLAEMQAVLRTQFLKVDQNRDGHVNVEEVLKLLPVLVRGPARAKVAEYLGTQDLNRDGRVTLDEVMRSAALSFGKMDGNRDGFLSAAEIKKAQQKR